jgi:hypothetical protein
MTDEWRLEPLVARVVAWHNRHPLARRITPPQVQSIGFVALPFVATTAAFSEDFIASVSPARVARWAARHAREAAAAPTGGPLKQVAVDDTRAPDDAGVVTRYAMTAAVSSAGQRTRLLVGPDAKAPVLGRRLWSRPRAAAAGAGVMAALCLLATGIALPGAEPAPPATEPPALTAVVPPGVGGPPEAAAPQGDSPPDAEPRLGRIELPPLVPEQARAKVPERMPDEVPAVAAVPPEAFWAVTTRLLRTRAESLQWLQAMDELLRGPGSEKLQVELLPEGDDWRVVGWPFTRRADAERARALLLARGLKVEVVDF